MRRRTARCTSAGHARGAKAHAKPSRARAFRATISRDGVPAHATGGEAVDGRRVSGRIHADHVAHRLGPGTQGLRASPPAQQGSAMRGSGADGARDIRHRKGKTRDAHPACPGAERVGTSSTARDFLGDAIASSAFFATDEDCGKLGSLCGSFDSLFAGLTRSSFAPCW